MFALTILIIFFKMQTIVYLVEKFYYQTQTQVSGKLKT